MFDMDLLKLKLPYIIWKNLPFDLDAKNESFIDKKGNRGKSFSDEKHLKSTLSWLCRAQDATEDGGVSRGYKTTKWIGYIPHGWEPSYPETTGYIIPTMLSASEIFQDKSLKDRAIQMADWELDIQMSSGAVMGSVVTARPSPAVFNTGQVIFGLLAIHDLTNDNKYINAASKAAKYLLKVQEPDGLWLTGNSKFAKKKSTIYNTRVAWALIEFGLKNEMSECVEAGRANIERALKLQRPNGWFENNCLSNPVQPLLHTIVYATRGILESGIRLKEEIFIQCALRTLDKLIECQRKDGGLPGRADCQWRNTVLWDCVTGDAQAAVAWLRAEAITGDPKYGQAARKTIDFVKRTQNLDHVNPGIRGGVKGSFPFCGEYGQYEMLNWAAKFLCDALMMVNDSNIATRGICG
jgi:uncharacterized protein YyaL (SSP411 family)